MTLQPINQSKHLPLYQIQFMLRQSNSGVFVLNHVSNSVVVTSKASQGKKIVPFTKIPSFNIGPDGDSQNQLEPFVIQDLGRKSDIQNDISYVWQHFTLNTSTMIYSCKYCPKNFEQEIQVRKVLRRHLIYHHRLIDFPQEKQHKDTVSAISEQASSALSYESFNQKAFKGKTNCGVKSSAYDHYTFDYVRQKAQCKYCDKKISARLGVLALSQHLSQYHAGKYSEERHQSNSSFEGLKCSHAGAIRKQRSSSIHQDLKVGKLALGLAHGVGPLRLKWILFSKLGISKDAANNHSIINRQNLQDNLEFVSTLKRKGITILALSQNQERTIKQKDKQESILVYSRAMKLNYRHFGQFLTITIYGMTKPCQYKAVAILAGRDFALRERTFGAIFCQKEITTSLPCLIVEFLTAMMEIPETIAIWTDSCLDQSSWDPLLLFEDINYVLTKANPTFRPFELQLQRSKWLMFSRQKVHFKPIQLQPSDRPTAGSLSQMIRQIQSKQNLRLSSSKKVYYNNPNKQSFLSTIPIRNPNEILLTSDSRNILNIIDNQYLHFKKNSESKNSSFILQQELIDLSFELASPIFKILRSQYIKNLAKCKIVKVESLLKVWIFEKGDNRSSYFILSYSIVDDFWRCHCLFLQKTGVPCCHLIKVVLQYGGSLAYYINSRWIIPRRQDQVRADKWQAFQILNKLYSEKRQTQLRNLHNTLLSEL